MPSFSAVLLAGGKSIRMGRDKALLPVSAAGQLLWQRQLGVLEELSPAEILWSGPPRPGLPDHLRLVSDQIDDAGPMAGLCASLADMRSDLLVALAIDLPHMTADYLRRLQSCCTASCGIVPQRHGLFEPLVAIYPRSVAAFAQRHLERKQHALQELICEALTEKLLHIHDIPDQDVPLFHNWNTPADR